MTSRAILIASLLACSLPALAQVPPVTAGCAEPGGCNFTGPSDQHDDRDPPDDDAPTSERQARNLYNDSIDKIAAGDFDGAIAEALQATRLDPSFEKARYQYAWLLMHEGRCDAAVVQARSITGPDVAKAEQLAAYCGEQITREQASRAQSYGIEIGGIESLQGEAHWVAPDGSLIPVTADSRIYLNERLVTGPGAHLVVRLKDDTTFTLQANSDMVLDEFVYDPNTSAGKITARLTKGVFRFVSGKMDKDPFHWNEKVVVPSGAFGIRGTDLEVHVVSDEFEPVNGCDAQGNCKDYKIVAAAILYSGEVYFENDKDLVPHEIHPNGRYHLITADGPVIELQPESTGGASGDPGAAYDPTQSHGGVSADPGSASDYK